MNRLPVQELLSLNVDPSSDSFWDALAASIQASSDTNFDRRAILNLKMIFSIDTLTKQKISLLAKLLSFTGVGLGNHFTQDLGEIFSNLFLSNNDPNFSEAYEFSTALRNLCIKNPSIKVPLFESLFEHFSTFLSKRPSLSTYTISQIFLIEITLITGQQSAKKEFAQSADLLHIAGAAQILNSVVDSTVQMTITEWIWRSIHLIKVSPDSIKKSLDDFAGIYDISKDNFRSSLHTFISSLNQEVSDNSCIHIPFKSLTAGKTNIHCNGCLDVNPDNIAIFFSDKLKNLPDVIVFRISYVSSANSTKNSLVFETRENVTGFQNVGETAPTKFTFSLGSTLDSATSSEYLRRLKKFKSARSGQDIKEPQRQRVVANKNPPKLPKKSPGTKEKKQSEMAMIEADLKEYQESSKRAIENEFNQIVSTMAEITEKLTGIEASLTQFQAQHEESTKTTMRVNDEISKNVTTLRKTFEANHAEAMTKREQLKKNAIEAITLENKKIIDATAEVFQSNAIVGLATSLDQAQANII